MSDINIIAIDPVTRRVTQSFNIVPVKVSGIEALLQLSIKTVLTTAGSDIFAPEYGGSARRYIKSGLYASDLPIIATDLGQAVAKAERQIFEEQEISTESIPADEKLQSMKLISVQWNREESCIDARILVTSVAGDSAVANLANQIRVN